MSEQRDERSVMALIDSAIDQLKNQRIDISAWSIALSPDCYRRFVDECTWYGQDGKLTTGVVMYRGMPVVGDARITGVALRKQKQQRSHLDGHTVTLTEYGEVEIDDNRAEYVGLTARQALALLTWLEENKAPLEQLAKEQA